MLTTCSKCGKVHDINKTCRRKVNRNKSYYSRYKDDEASNFRSSSAWKKKSEEIRERDFFLCQICLRERYKTLKKYNTENIEVHHIIKIKEDDTLKLDNNNLISLCSYHHKLADEGIIPAAELQEIIKDNPHH